MLSLLQGVIKRCLNSVLCLRCGGRSFCGHATRGCPIHSTAALSGRSGSSSHVSTSEMEPSDVSSLGTGQKPLSSSGGSDRRYVNQSCSSSSVIAWLGHNIKPLRQRQAHILVARLQESMAQSLLTSCFSQIVDYQRLLGQCGVEVHRSKDAPAQKSEGDVDA